ncbi:MAG: class I SAM-dependent methyltransferase [Thiogranum sp.]
MKGSDDPAAYEAWYHTARGRWIAEREFRLLQELLTPEPGATLLDVGCGSGHFSRRFAQHGLAVTGLDPDSASLAFAGTRGQGIRYLQGSALELPFADNSFDYTSAVTSLCFIPDPVRALQEMWRVTRNAVVLGLLNRHSLLHRKKQGRGSYTGARWDTADEVLKQWLPGLAPAPGKVMLRSGVFFPRGNTMARWSEHWLPGTLWRGAFLAVGLRKQPGAAG